MLYTLTAKPLNLPVRLALVGAFTLVTALSARISIPLEPVPFTMQVLVVLLAGMVLGGRDGALSQALYVGLIAMGLPIDARGLGTAALFGPTGGFLLGFIVAAFVVGYLTEKRGAHLWQRGLAGVAGVLCVYLFGVLHLSLYRNMGLDAAWNASAAPFLGLDLIKALLAAGLTESLRAYLRR
jgi:biotin transport system substrate-specific component